jgi:transposase
VPPSGTFLLSLWNASSPGLGSLTCVLKKGIPFVLGHALYMQAIHGGKAKYDKLDAHKLVVLLRGGMLPQASVYPAAMRATHDLLRRRMYLTRKRAEPLAHIQHTNSQDNLPEIGPKLAYKANRDGVVAWFPDPAVQKSMEVDLTLLGSYDPLLRALELHIVKAAKQHDANTLYLLQTVPGIGKILSLVLLYESHDIQRFPSVPAFVSYCRLVKCAKESASKRYGTAGAKLGNASLKWAFSEAAVLFLRDNPAGQKYLNPTGEKTRPGQRVDPPGPEAGACGLLPVKTPEGLRYAQVSPGVVSGVGEPDASLGVHGVSLRRVLRNDGIAASVNAQEHRDHNPQPSAVDWTPAPAPLHVAMVAKGTVGCPSPEPETNCRTEHVQPPGCVGRYEGTERFLGRRGQDNVALQSPSRWRENLNTCVV